GPEAFRVFQGATVHGLVSAAHGVLSLGWRTVSAGAGGGALEPDADALRVQVVVVAQQPLDLGFRQLAPVRAQARQHERVLTLHQQALALAARVAQALPEIDEGVDQLVQVARQALDVGDAPEMREQDLLRLVAAQALDGSVQALGLELHRRGGRQHESTARRDELAIGQPERVAAEYGARARVDHAEVVARVARGVEEQQLAPVQQQGVVVRGFDHALGRYRHRRPEFALRALRAVDLVHPGLERRGIDQVARPARVHYQGRARKAAHHLARAAGMVEVHVRGNDVGDVVRAEAAGGERLEQGRERVAGAGVDDRGAALLRQQVEPDHARAVVAGVDQRDAV